MVFSVESTITAAYVVLVFEALERLRFEAFFNSQTPLQKGEIINLVREISDSLNKEHVDGYVENNTLCEIEER